jgi:A/G-specific adenine glycosylase
MAVESMSAELRQSAIRDALTGWYRRAARALPWRSPPDAAQRPDPYRVWLSEVMLQQTTVAAVQPYFARFTAQWPTLADLAAAEPEAVLAAWAGLGYYSRARNLIACARTVAEQHGGAFPADEAALRVLPGVGDYTAAAIAAIAFGRDDAVPVDANIERVVARLFAIAAPLPAGRAAIRAAARALWPARGGGDFAQALMDLGATICTPKKPACVLCPLGDGCAARARGDQDTFPRKAAKKTGALRRGAAFVVTRGPELLVRTRPEKGLLGAMTEVPTSEWRADNDDKAALAQAPVLKAVARWQRKAGVVTHVFTHFPLELVVYAASVPARSRAPAGMRWVPLATLNDEALPNVMRKVIDHAITRKGTA